MHGTVAFSLLTLYFLLSLLPILCCVTSDDISTCQDYPEEHVVLITLANRQYVWKEVYWLRQFLF